MRAKKGLTLRSTVNTIVLIAVLATVVISTVIAYRSEKQSLTRTTFQLNHVYTEKISDTVNNLFVNMKQSLQVTGDYLSQDLTREDLHEQLERFQRGNPSFNAVFIVDRNGYLVDGSNVEPISRGTKVNTVGTLQAIKEQRPLISEPYLSGTNKLIVMISQPIKDSNGQYTGFIGGSIRLHETNIFQTILGTAPSQDNGTYAYVVSSSGRLLYHPDPDRIGELVVGNEVINDLMAGNGGTKRIINSKGKDMLASFSYIQEAGWGIVSQTPTDVVLNSTRKLVMKIVLYMLPALLIFMAVIYWIVGKVAAPFSKLAQFATLLSPTQSSSDVLPKINEWNYEANVLHKALARAIRHFRYQFESLSIEAQTDPLTGLFNRRTMDHFVQNWIAQKASFSMLVMDLDNFKQVNDTYGHDKGDDVLKYLASSLQRMFGENHVCCRFGGEEFVVLVLDEDFNKAIEDAESIRKFMAETKSPTGSAVTLSIGVSHYPGFAHNADQLFRLADEAMYRAKRSGRNRVELEQGAGFDSTEKTS